MGNGLCVETSSSWTVFDWLDKVVGNLGAQTGLGRTRNDDDVIDRFSHHYTTIILVIFAIVVSTKQYAGDPIQCWCPAQFTEAHVNYANQVCWVSNTYYVPMENVIPSQDSEKNDAILTYYQWVPMILLFMALLFKVPRTVWKAIIGTSAISIDKVVTMIYELQLAPRHERDEKLNELTEYLHIWLESAQQYRRHCCHQWKQKVSKYTCLVCGRRYGNFFVTSHMFVKVLYFLNALLHYFALNAFLGENFSGWGFEILTGLADDNPEYLKTSPRFPRVTLCDFQIRQMANVQRWTVQCVLPINLFNSKIFLFIWFWLVFLVIVSFCSLCSYFYALMFPIRRIEYIKKYLILRKLIAPRSESDRRMVNRFVLSYLKFDGVFVLRVAAHNATDILVGQIIENLFVNFKRQLLSSDPKYLNGDMC